MSYQMPVRTTPLAYVPQAMGIALARMLGLGGLGLLFMGRLFNLMFFTAMGCLTIRRMPFGKEVAAGAALLPMTLHLAASFSYDVMIIALSGYFSAVCLDRIGYAQQGGAAHLAGAHQLFELLQSTGDQDRSQLGHQVFHKNALDLPGQEESGPLHGF